MHIPRTAHRCGTKMATSIAALTPLSFFLTACGGGSSIDGTYYYYGKDHAGEGSQLSIKGANTTFLDLDTKGIAEHGALNDQGTRITWDPTLDDIQYIYDNDMDDDVSPVMATTSGDSKVITLVTSPSPAKRPKSVQPTDAHSP